MRLIDADELRKNVTEVLMSPDKYTLDKIEYLIDFAPTVDVIQCNECKYFEKAECIDGFLICPASGMEIHENDFCSYAERRSRDD